MNWTTRRFPRTSQAEPWRGVLTHHKRPLQQRVADWIFTATLSGGVAFLAFLYLSR